MLPIAMPGHKSTSPGEATPRRLFMLFIMASMLSFSCAPVPNAGIVTLCVLCDSVGIPIGESLSLLIAIDFICDRMATVVNCASHVLTTGVVCYKAEANKRAQYENTQEMEATPLVA